MLHFLASIGAFALHLAAALVLLGLFMLAYMRTTPHAEMELIRKGNAAAAFGLGGALVGFAIALGRAISYSDGIGETVLWGLIGLAVQVAGHVLLSRLVPRLYIAIEEGDMAAGILKAAVAIALGIVNAASMTP
jgi:putative membrane protein